MAKDITQEEAQALVGNGEYASKFDEATGGAVPAEVEDDVSFAPRAIFTSDAKPDLSKMQISQLRLAQGMTAEVTERKATIGQYVLSNFPAYDEVILVPLAAQNVRTYKPDPRQPPKCYAPTGLHGIGDPGVACDTCPMAKWGPRNPVTGKGTPPPCKEGVIVRAYSVTHRSIVDFKFDGSARSKGAFIQQQAMAFGFANFAVKMHSSSARNDRGQWYVPEVEMLAEIPEAHVEPAQKWYELVSQQAQMTTAEATAQIAQLAHSS